MHTLSKVALAAAIGIASAQASAVSVISATDLDDSNLDVFYSGTYSFAAENKIPGQFQIDIGSEVIESSWFFSWNPRFGTNENAVQFTMTDSNGATVGSADFSTKGTSEFTTAGLDVGSYIMSMSVVGGTFDAYTFSGDATFVTLAGDVNPVPLPAAAWLFISGIAGYAGVSLKKKKKAA